MQMHLNCLECCCCCYDVSAEGRKEAVDSEQTGANQLVWHRNVSKPGTAAYDAV